jgi:hypothetical protein
LLFGVAIAVTLWWSIIYLWWLIALAAAVFVIINWRKIFNRANEVL